MQFVHACTHIQTHARTQEPCKPQDYLQPIFNQDSSSASCCPIHGRSAQTAHPSIASRPHSSCPRADSSSAAESPLNNAPLSRSTLAPTSLMGPQRDALPSSPPLTVGVPHPQGTQELAGSCPGSNKGATLGRRGFFSGKPQRVEAGLLGLSPNSTLASGILKSKLLDVSEAFALTANHEQLHGAGQCIEITAHM